MTKMKEKNPTRFRYEKIDECLVKRTRKWTAQDLRKYVIQELEMENGPGATMGRRQINYDIANMIRFHKAPIETKREGNNIYYFYTDENYSFKRPVYEEDLKLLTQVVDILGQIKGLNHSREVAELRMRLQTQKNKIMDGGKQAIYFQSLPTGLGEEHVQPLHDAIINEQVVRIVHQRYNCNEQRTWTLHPYSVLEYEKQWYLYCYVHGKKDYGLFALDRMKEIKTVKQDYKACELPLPDYLKEIMGVTKLADEEVQDIEITVSAKMAPYFLSKKLHHSQMQLGKHEDGSLHLGYKLRINPELISKLLSYGKEVKVLKSARLQQKMKEAIEELNKQYAVREIRFDGTRKAS